MVARGGGFAEPLELGQNINTVAPERQRREGFTASAAVADSVCRCGRSAFMIFGCCAEELFFQPGAIARFLLAATMYRPSPRPEGPSHLAGRDRRIRRAPPAPPHLPGVTRIQATGICSDTVSNCTHNPTATTPTPRRPFGVRLWRFRRPNVCFSARNCNSRPSALRIELLRLIARQITLGEHAVTAKVRQRPVRNVSRRRGNGGAAWPSPFGHTCTRSPCTRVSPSLRNSRMLAPTRIQE